MAGDNFTRSEFDLSPWREIDPLTLFQAAWLLAGIPPTLPATVANEARYANPLATARGWLGRLENAAKAGDLPIIGDVPTKEKKISGAVGGSQYLGTQSRPAKHRTVAYWPAAPVALADLRAYAESIGQRPGFFFPGAPVGATGGAVVANHSAPAPDTKEPPQEWRNGLKRMAWEEAVKLVREHGVLHGPALWAAMKARDDVKEAGRDSGQIEPRVCSGKLNRGEGRVSKTQVQNTWRKTLVELLKNHA